MRKGLILLSFKHFNCCAYSLLLMLCISVSGVNAQTVDAIKRRQIFSTQYQDSVAVKKMFNKYDSVKDLDRDKAINILFAITDKAKAKGMVRALYIAYCDLGVITWEKGEYYKSIEYLKQAYPYMSAKENIGYSDLWYTNMGTDYSSLGKYDVALNYYYKALAAQKGLPLNRQPPVDSSDTYNHMAIVWALLGELTQSLNTFKEAEAIAVRKKDSNMIAMLYMNIADIYYKQKKYDEAEAYYNKTIDFTRNTEYRGELAGALGGLGLIANFRKDYKKALDYMMQSKEVAKTAHMNAYEDASMESTLGYVYMHLKDYAKAKQLLTHAMESAISMQQKELLISIGPHVARLYTETGDYKTAYKYLKIYSSIKDSLYREEKVRSLDALTNARMAEKNKAMLAQQLHIARQKTQLQQKNVLIGGTILGALFILVISIVLVRNYKHKQAIQQSFIAQLQQKQEINQLKAQVRGEEQERQRIAHELHDSIASQLWAIKLNVDSIQSVDRSDEVYSKKLDTIFQQLTDATQDIRKTAHNLMPDLLLEEGIATALASVCDKIGKHTMLEVDFMEYGEVPRVDKEIELSIYRMVQELIQNVMKHAQNATSLLVQLSCNGTLLNITVEDNGTAFKERENEEGIGLQQIRKRTATLKGHFDLQSVPGKGTTAYLEFDLQNLL